MSLLDLTVLYALIGVACAVVVYRRGDAAEPRRRAASAFFALLIWPLWVPLALGPDRRPSAAPVRDLGERIRAELGEAVEAAEGSPFAILLPRSALDRIDYEVGRISARVDELDRVLAQRSLDPERAGAHLVELERSGASEQALRTARQHRDNVERLRAMRESDRAALRDLAETVTALKSQLLVARYSGASADGVGGIVSELWSRVEGLGEALSVDLDDDLGEVPEDPPADPAALRS